MNLKISKISLLALISAFASTPLFAAEPADTAYTNGKIYTVNEKSAWAEAVAIKDGKFVKVGSNPEVGEFIGKNTVVIDLAGKFVMPGIHDLHVHPAYKYAYVIDGHRASLRWGKRRASLSVPCMDRRARARSAPGERRPSRVVRLP
jgi:predicted amidohydrolase YtcJ